MAFSLALTVLLSLLSCSKKVEEEIKNAYEMTVPAEVSDTAGVGRANYVPPLTQQDDTGRVIVVDPGHGFVDGGCGEGVYPDGTLEKDINFAVASKLAERLGLLGYTVIVTHDGVNYPAADTNQNRIFSATERVSYINSLKKADFVLSVHVNSFDDDTVSGMNIYYQQSGVKLNTWSGDIAASIADKIGEAYDTPNKPNVKDGTDPNTSFALTRDVKFASSLIEIGFVSNATDAENMVDAEWQQTLANAIADGIDAFFRNDSGDNNG